MPQKATYNRGVHAKRNRRRPTALHRKVVGIMEKIMNSWVFNNWFVKTWWVPSACFSVSIVMHILNVGLTDGFLLYTAIALLVMNFFNTWLMTKKSELVESYSHLVTSLRARLRNDR